MIIIQASVCVKHRSGGKLMAKTEDIEEPSERSRDELRQELLEEASERLKGQGVEDFSTSKVAEACDTSRQMIYTFFGGKTGLIQAVYEYKGDELATRLDLINDEDPLERFYELGRIYRNFMLEHAALFDTVFSLETTRNLSRSDDSVVGRMDAHEYFDEALRECVEAGLLPDETDVEELTDMLWAGVNGVLRLQMVDYYPDEETARKHYFKLATNILFGESDEDSQWS